MADSERTRTAEQVRSDYRKQLFRARRQEELAPPDMTDIIEGDADGLIHIDFADDPIRFTVKEWADRPVFPNILVNTLFVEMRRITVPESQYVQISAEEFGNTTDFPSSNFPLEKEIPLHLTAGIEGKFQLRCRLEPWNLSPIIDSLPAPFELDRTGPIRPGVPKSIIVHEPLITEEVLARDKGINCEVPDFEEEKKGAVTLAVALLKEPPTEEPDREELVFLGGLPLTRQITIPEASVRKLGSMLMYIVYFLYDKAGNRSDMPYPTPVQVALGKLPMDPDSCSVPLAEDDGVIDRADAAFPTTVWIDPIADYQEADGIVITWGGTRLPRTAISAHLPFPLTITVPRDVINGEYDFAGADSQPIKVDYEVYRGDYSIPSKASITVNVNLKVAGPPDPGPGPENPLLGLVEFLSSSGSSTELVPADIGEDAQGTITLTKDILDHVLAGDLLTLYWNGEAVSSPAYAIVGTETVDQKIPIVIPWADIEKVPVIKQLPLHYTITRPGLINPQQSLPTLIDVEVEIVKLPDIEFPNKHPDRDLINCDGLEEKDGEWGIYVKIPVSNYLKEGVEVDVSWATFDWDDVTLLPDTDRQQRLTVTREEESNGLLWFIPYVECLKPTYDTGNQFGYGKAMYQIVVRGTDVKSELASIMIAVFELNAHCRIPRP
ncbi:hypothetical protein [Pseudomonas sp. SDO55104_S430]